MFQALVLLRVYLSCNSFNSSFKWTLKIDFSCLLKRKGDLCLLASLNLPIFQSRSRISDFLSRTASQLLVDDRIHFEKLHLIKEWDKKLNRNFAHELERIGKKYRILLISVNFPANQITARRKRSSTRLSLTPNSTLGCEMAKSCRIF